jgi:hypothetical protein
MRFWPILFLLVSPPAFSNVDLKKIIALQQAQLNKFINRSGRLGDIKQSILPEDEFQRRHGTEWVLMDGRSIEGSDLAEVLGIFKLPNAAGKFLRAVGGKSLKVGEPQNLSTEMPKAKFKTSLDGPHSHTITRVIGSGGKNPLAKGGDFVLSSFELNVTGGVHEHAIKGGDKETRPGNIAFHTYIKINE